MTKKKSTTKTKLQDTIAETEQTPQQKYETEIQQVLEEWPEKALKLLAADSLALEAPDGAREIKPRTLDAALLHRLEPIGRDAVRSWVILPPAPKPAVFSLPPPSKEAVERAEQLRRIEESHTHEVDMRRIMNEDRERAGLPPLP